MDWQWQRPDDGGGVTGICLLVLSLSFSVHMYLLSYIPYKEVWTLLMCDLMSRVNVLDKQLILCPCTLTHHIKRVQCKV
jgi:hypothetical protein